MDLDKVRAGAAHCAICGAPILRGEEALVTPDFLADDTDPLWRFADAAIHRACFVVWDRRKAFVARFNAVSQQLRGPDGSYPHMTSEGEIVLSTPCDDLRGSGSE
jgi:hypothetical protein